MTTAYQKLKDTDPEKFELCKQRNRERAKLWREQHPEYAKAYMKPYMERYRQSEDNCEKIRKRAAAWNKDNIKRAMVGRARRRAEKQGWEFSITESDFEIPPVCPIYGIELDQYAAGVNNPHTPSLDRIDSTKGYIPGNVPVISLRANKHKSDASRDELLLLAEWAKHAL